MEIFCLVTGGAVLGEPKFMFILLYFYSVGDSNRHKKKCWNADHCIIGSAGGRRINIRESDSSKGWKWGVLSSIRRKIGRGRLQKETSMKLTIIFLYVTNFELGSYLSVHTGQDIIHQFLTRHNIVFFWLVTLKIFSTQPWIRVILILFTSYWKILDPHFKSLIWIFIQLQNCLDMSLLSIKRSKMRWEI